VTAVAITTALNTSYMAEQLSIFGLVVGVALLLTGIGLVILALAVFGREPATETRKAAPATRVVTG
jgi:multisubunit Na+/H+ antiporter MnhC subunit